jgi:hypothetical protein
MTKLLVGGVSLQWLVLLVSVVVFVLADGDEGLGVLVLQGVAAAALTGSAALTVRADRRNQDLGQ